MASLTDTLRARKVTPVEMTRFGERFFTSLGFEALPQTFWERSLFVKPRDREVVCHASAWNINNVDDLRMKMCIDQTEEDFRVIHHELGHNFYERAYNQQPMIFRDGANDGFHEAIGDTIALSVTPEYLVKVGLLERAPDASGDIPLLLRSALERLAFLPFGLVVDQWRWRVFSGEITPDRYNSAWWELRERYQGVRPPSPRGEEFFDPGAKYHVPANTPYAALFPRSRAAVPVPPRAREGSRLHHAAAPLLNLRQRAGRQAAADDARDGPVAPVARRARGAHRPAPDGRHRHGRLFRSAQDVARRAEQGSEDRMAVVDRATCRKHNARRTAQ